MLLLWGDTLHLRGVEGGDATDIRLTGLRDIVIGDNYDNYGALIADSCSQYILVMYTRISP